MCLDGAGGRGSAHVNKGDELKVVARINVDPNDHRSVVAGGEHRGQMALFYFYLAPDSDGPAPAPPPAQMYACQDSACVAVDSGVDLPTCKLAC